MPRRGRDPELDEAAAQAGRFKATWPGPGAVAPHAVAHRDPETRVLSFHVHLWPEQLPYLEQRGLAELLEHAELWDDGPSYYLHLTPRGFQYLASTVAAAPA